MSHQKYASIRLNIFKESEISFLAALEKENIPYGRINTYSNMPQASGILASITAIAEAMPWKKIADIFIAWLDARKSRQVIIQINDGTVINIKGYSSKDVQALLKTSVNVSVLDTKREE
ncbi:hypothetical protein THUN1379_17640 [Paludibacterium sp. THUN1379]|uniref:hypothetical protein n=1 Tax=Paludibacterium sp. THUN1379 TaxID=3112107 RepID=UPI00308FB05C|nr:hypothetical protein THUN1379_17640 [Paludibacterium sp. THUN1379]